MGGCEATTTCKLICTQITMQEVLRSFSRVLQNKLCQQDSATVEILMAEEVLVYMDTKVLITQMLLISVIQYHPPLQDSKFPLVQYWMGKFMYKIMFQLLVQIIFSPNTYADNSSYLFQFCINS